VAKKIDLGNMKNGEEKLALQEANLLKTIKHPHIVKYLYSFLTDQSLTIIMEYCEEGDLQEHVNQCIRKA
jgi:NIMA (never in mitosis gene a)-related kinase